MKKLLLIVPVIMLAGCFGSAPIKQSFPGVPEDLLVACPDLKKVDPSVNKLSDIIDVVSDNYAQYYECKSKVDDWITWYNGQKKIYDGK